MAQDVDMAQEVDVEVEQKADVEVEQKAEVEIENLTFTNINYKKNIGTDTNKITNIWLTKYPIQEDITEPIELVEPITINDNGDTLSKDTTIISRKSLLYVDINDIITELQDMKEELISPTTIPNTNKKSIQLSSCTSSNISYDQKNLQNSFNYTNITSISSIENIDQKKSIINENISLNNTIDNDIDSIQPRKKLVQANLQGLLYINNDKTRIPL